MLWRGDMNEKIKTKRIAFENFVEKGNTSGLDITEIAKTFLEPGQRFKYVSQSTDSMEYIIGYYEKEK